MEAIVEELRQLAKEGKLKLEAANLGEGDDCTYPIHNVEVEDGVITLSSNDYLCHPRD
jgi:hypothetical protein